MYIDVIIPSLNESAYLSRTLASVRIQSGPFGIRVADGGSDDSTRDALNPDDIWISSPRGRAVQMNAGAKDSSADILLFLHADTVLPVGAFDAIRQEMTNPAVVAGCFRLAFDDDVPWLRRYAWATKCRWKRIVFGDRTFFVRREVFEEMGGYREIPAFEDLDFVQRAGKIGLWVFLDATVTTSARRFQKNGIVRQQLRNIALWLAYHAGIKPARLRRYYEAHGEVKV